MATILHLVQDALDPVATECLRQQAAAGDRVIVVRLEGAPPPQAPGGVDVRRAPEDLSYASLLDLVFEADRVIAW